MAYQERTKTALPYRSVNGKNKYDGRITWYRDWVRPRTMKVDEETRLDESSEEEVKEEGWAGKVLLS